MTFLFPAQGAVGPTQLSAFAPLSTFYPGPLTLAPSPLSLGGIPFGLVSLGAYTPAQSPLA